MSGAKLEYNPLKGTRTSLKGWVTRYLDELRLLKDNSQLTKESLLPVEDSINRTISKIEENEFKIDEVYAKHDITEHNLGDMPSRESEAKLTIDFIKKALQEIADLYVNLQCSMSQQPRALVLLH